MSAFNFSKKICFVFSFMLFFSFSKRSYSQELVISEEKKSSFVLQDLSQTFEISLLKESILLGGGLALTGTEFVLDNLTSLRQYEWSGKRNVSDVFFLDRLLMNPYSSSLNLAGTVTMGLCIAFPLVSLFSDWTSPSYQDLAVYGTMYAESLALAEGIKGLLKFFVFRPRPYCYFDDAPEEKIKDGDWSKSWPSGHTTYAFAGAAFASLTFILSHPDSILNIPVTSISFALAATTGALRIASGNHFLTDVLTGAVIGSFCGFAIPLIHYIRKENSSFDLDLAKKNAEICITPLSAGIKINF